MPTPTTLDKPRMEQRPLEHNLIQRREVLYNIQPHNIGISPGELL
jgi:hypothetical protein